MTTSGGAMKRWLVWYTDANNGRGESIEVVADGKESAAELVEEMYPVKWIDSVEDL